MSDQRALVLGDWRFFYCLFQLIAVSVKDTLLQVRCVGVRGDVAVARPYYAHGGVDVLLSCGWRPLN